MERIYRIIERKRGDRIVEHHFTTLPQMLKADSPLRKHIAKMFVEGLPERPQTASQLPVLQTLWAQIDSPFAQLAKDAGYRGFASAQHRIVQDHFWKFCPGLIATELPLFDKNATGLADFLLLRDMKLILPDFKPYLHKCLPEAMSQLFRYREMLSENAKVKREDIICVAFDDTQAYQLTS